MLRFIDSFNHYNTAQLTRKYTSNTNLTINASTGRDGASLRYSGGGNAAGSNNYLTKTLDAQATWIVGFAFKINMAPSGKMMIVGLADGGTTQVEVRLKTDLTLEVTRNATILGTTTYALTTSTWYHIEIKITIADSSSMCKIRVNGSEKLSLTSVDTKNTANATANQITIGMFNNPNNDVTGSSFTADYDDLFIMDTTGSVNNDLSGDCTVKAYYPNGDGNSSNWLGSDGNSTNNYLLVDENPANDDTDYVETSTTTDKDLYAFENVSATPKGIQFCITARKTDGGTRTVCPVIRSGGTDYDQTNQDLSTSYVIYTEVIENNPNTAAAWTSTNFNSAEFGIKLVA